MKTIIKILKEHIVWRSQIFKLAKSDIKKTYSGAALGWAWTLIKPSVTIFVFWFAFSIGLKLGKDIGPYPYILWLIAGYIPWFFMSDMLTGGAGSLRKYSYLVTKVKFPIATIPTFVALAQFAVHLMLMVIVILIFAGFGFFPDLYLLQLPIYMLLMLVSFTIWGLFSSMLGAISKDFLNLVKSLTMAVFWLSGIMWDINDIGEHHPWLQTILMFNPVTFIATGYRNCFIYKTWIWEQPIAFTCFSATTVIVLALGVWAHYKLEKDVPDVL
ncbi:MAG: ABC transporter permease [Clostridiales Family XIII bacterium]|jgi:teichoic acid transport system permease protein|nr:ABC transporter permease [Clostridiales Family XIII bacterium]